MSRLSMLQESIQQRHSSSMSMLHRPKCVTSTTQLDFPHQLFVPRSYEPGYAYPLVVWLHSDSSSELELEGIMQSLSQQNYVAIAPRGNIKCRGQQRRYRWGVSPTECAAAEDMVWECIRSAENNLSIHPDRIFLAGFGGGATLAQWIGLKYANHFAGVVSLSGSFPRTKSVLSNWKQARDLQVLFTQCEGSTICPDDELVRAVRLAYQASLKYRFVQSRGCEDSPEEADGLHDSTLATANRFMMGIVTNTDISLAPELVSDNANLEFGCN